MPIKVLPGPRFSERTTLKLGGCAQAEVVVVLAGDASAPGEDLIQEFGDGLSAELARHASRPFVLGHGSNLLAGDGDLDLVVVSVAPGEPILADGESETDSLVRVPGGLMLPRLVGWAAVHGLSGLEGLAGIPGTVGGAVAMNAGSYGQEMAGVLSRVLVWDGAGGVRWIGPELWEARYRGFTPLKADATGALERLEAPWLALAAELRLARAESESVRRAVSANLARKIATQPVGAATCGCAFKNPPASAGEGLSAGRMLDELGFKGKSLRGMAFSAMHANFLVNEGGGTAQAALELLALAQEAVKARFGLTLELEVRVVS